MAEPSATQRPSPPEVTWSASWPSSMVRARVRADALHAGDRVGEPARAHRRHAERDADPPPVGPSQRRRRARRVDAPDGARQRVGHPDRAVGVGEPSGGPRRQRHPAVDVPRCVDVHDRAVERRRPDGALPNAIVLTRRVGEADTAGGWVHLEDVARAAH